MSQILIDGFSEIEILELAQDEEFQKLIFSNQPVTFHIGTSEILGQFFKTSNQLRITLSHIIGGGEGVLIKLMNLFRKFASANKIKQIEWIVHAVDCSKPNPKLQRILKLKQFEVFNDKNEGEVYRKIEFIKS